MPFPPLNLVSVWGAFFTVGCLKFFLVLCSHIATLLESYSFTHPAPNIILKFNYYYNNIFIYGIYVQFLLKKFVRNSLQENVEIIMTNYM